MRKILFFALLLAVFLLAVIVDRNVLQETRTARSTTVPPEIRNDDVLEIILGHPDGGRSNRPPPSGTVDDSRTESRSRGTDPSPPRVDPDANRTSDGTAGTQTAPPTPNETRPRLKKYYYEVEEGDTLTAIAKKLFDDESKVKELIEWNELRDPNFIQAGQRLRYYK